jgi:hypothetical protein
MEKSIKMEKRGQFCFVHYMFNRPLVVLYSIMVSSQPFKTGHRMTVINSKIIITSST